MINKRSYTIQQDRLRCVSLQHSHWLQFCVPDRVCSSVQSAETDEVSNIVVMIVSNEWEGGLVKIDDDGAA